MKKPSLDVKPSYVCSCGRKFWFILYETCPECEKVIPKLPNCVPFDPEKYRDFCRRVDDVGLDTATKELTNKENSNAEE